MVPRGGALLPRKIRLLELSGKADYFTEFQGTAAGCFSPRMACPASKNRAARLKPNSALNAGRLTVH